MLELNKVSKTFNPGTVNEKKALDGLSVTLAEGDFVTIVGSNGAGKSTLFNAIAGGFYVDEGSITLAGEDITFQPEYRRSRVLGRLFQDPMRGTAPHMTIEENLALAYLRTAKHQRAFFSRVSKADKAFFREQLARLDMGLEDRMKQPVGLLSGGQRQRVSLARAFLKNAPILVLDEATASLDMKSEEQIQKEIERLASGRTTFIIAHRFSTIRMADRILVLEKGRVVADGTHEELMASSPLYRELYNKQQMVAEEEGGAPC